MKKRKFLPCMLSAAILFTMLPAVTMSAGATSGITLNVPGDKIVESFEGMEDFTINPAGDLGWSYIDADGMDTYGIEGMEFPGMGQKMSYISFNPKQTTPAIDNMAAKSGDKFLACFAATKTLNNEDYLISPEINAAADFNLSFFAKTFKLDYGLERFKVGYSTTGKDKEDFTFVQTGNYTEAPADEWTNFSFDIPKEAKYVTICCVSTDAFIFMLDDISLSIPRPEGSLFVNGVDIFSVPGHTVACGDGTATYNVAENTLTLDNATITKGYNGSGISSPGENKLQDLNIVLTGKNTIKADSQDNEIIRGIVADKNINISGTGSLLTSVESNKTGTFMLLGVASFSGVVNIKNSDLTFLNKSTQIESSIAIDSSGEEVTGIDGAVISADGFNMGMNVPGNNLSITNKSTITIENANRGISGGLGPKLVIKDSKVNIDTSGPNALSILSGGIVEIENSTVKAVSPTSNAIYTDGSIDIKGTSNITASGYYPALFAVGNIDISGGEVEASASNDIAIFSKGIINITGGTLHAKGGEGFAAVAARAVKNSEGAVSAKIVLGANAAEVTGAKIAVSDWFSSGTEERSWTSFILKDETNPLAADLSNALNEITISHAFGAWEKEDETNHKRVCGCGETEREAHIFETYVSDNNATCTADGTKTATCTKCTATKTVTDVGSMLEHTYGVWVKEDETNHKRVCGCGETEREAHVFETYVSDNNATCTADGTKTATCTKCTATKTVTDAGSMLEHTYGGWQKNDADTHKKVCSCGDTVTAPHCWDNGVITVEPTVDMEGTKTFTCTECGETKTEKIEKLTRYGDVNGDGKINLQDVMQLQKYLAGIMTENDIDLIAADVNGDEKISLEDVLLIQQYLAEIINTFPIKD